MPDYSQCVTIDREICHIVTSGGGCVCQSVGNRQANGVHAEVPSRVTLMKCYCMSGGLGAGEEGC